MQNGLQEPVQKLQRMQYIVEAIVHYALGVEENQRQGELLDFLALFELGKAALNLRAYFASADPSQLLAKSDAARDALHKEAKQDAETRNFEADFCGESYAKLRALPAEDLKRHIAGTLERIKNGQTAVNQTFFNSEYAEKLPRSQKEIGVVSKLPLPREMRAPHYKSFAEYLRIVAGEVLFILRPLIYCLLLRVYGVRSFKPYVASLVIDLVRLLLQRRMRFASACEKIEYDQRLNFLLFAYLFRNPVYQQITRAKVAEPFLNAVFGNGKLAFVKKFALMVMDMQSSYSILM